MRQLLTLGMLTIAAAGLGLAQRGTVNINPRITGGGDSSSGKCIVRIMVDNTVNVRIGNGQILVDTVEGQPSRNDGSECTSMLRNGRNLSDFRFRGIDGRGEVRLASDPRQDQRGEAVISIRDTKGGDEGYTFEVSWQGDNGNSNTGGGFFGGNNNNNNNNNDGVYNNDGRYNNNGSYNNNGRNNNGNNNNGKNNNVAGYDRAVTSCMERVRSQIQRDYNVNNVNFDNMNANNNSGGRDRISGTARSGNSNDQYRYSCQGNLNNGNIRSISVSRY